MANYRKRGDTVQVTIRKGKYKYKPITRTFKTKSLARTWATRVEAEIDAGTFVDGRNSRGIKIVELIDKYEREFTVEKSLSSQKAESVRLVRLRQMFNLETLYTLTEEKVVQEFRAMAKSKSKRGTLYSRSTVRKHMQDLSNVLDTAQRIWKYPVPYGDVAKEARRTLVKRSVLNNYDYERDTRLKDGDYQRLKAYRHEDDRTLFKWFALFAIETGMRRGEIQNMKWEQVDWDKWVYELEGQKSDGKRKRHKKGRDVPLTKRAMAILRIVRSIRKNEKKREGFVWGWENGKSIYDGIKRVYKKLGIENVTVHDLRHEFGGHAIDREVDVRLVGAVLGHSDLKSTMRYTRAKGHQAAKILDAKLKR